MPHPRLIDLTGQRFGRWRILRQAGNDARGGTVWAAVCDCGAAGTPRGADLRNGRSVSCGCYRDQVIGAQRRTHAASNTRLHRIWKNMRGRCLRPTNPGFRDYGGRGIGICGEWSSFATFQTWALANGYDDGLSLERVDVNGDYIPDNCTWANATTQSRNRRFVVKSPDGRPWSLVGHDNGISNAAYRSRLSAGWTHQEAATHPMFKRRAPRKRGAAGRFT